MRPPSPRGTTPGWASEVKTVRPPFSLLPPPSSPLAWARRPARGVLPPPASPATLHPLPRPPRGAPPRGRGRETAGSLTPASRLVAFAPLAFPASQGQSSPPPGREVPQLSPFPRRAWARAAWKPSRGRPLVGATPPLLLALAGAPGASHSSPLSPGGPWPSRGLPGLLPGGRHCVCRSWLPLWPWGSPLSGEGGLPALALALALLLALASLPSPAQRPRRRGSNVSCAGAGGPLRGPPRCRAWQYLWDKARLSSRLQYYDRSREVRFPWGKATRPRPPWWWPPPVPLAALSEGGSGSGFALPPPRCAWPGFWGRTSAPPGVERGSDALPRRGRKALRSSPFSRLKVQARRIAPW